MAALEDLRGDVCDYVLGETLAEAWDCTISLCSLACWVGEGEATSSHTDGTHSSQVSADRGAGYSLWG